MWFRLVLESIRFGAEALRSNLLRTILSLLGVTIGIFAIIAVLTMVDSLDRSVKNSFSFITDKQIYIQRFPWSFSDDYPWWKYFNRPVANFSDFKYLEKNATQASAIAIFASRGNRTIRYGNSALEGATVQGVTYGYQNLADIKISAGRYFTEDETSGGRNVCLIGADIAASLFPAGNAIGNQVRIKGLKFAVIAVLEKQGENLLGVPSNDNLVLITWPRFTSMYDISRKGTEPVIVAKGVQDDPGLEHLEAELKGLLRNKRGIKPWQEENFSLNRPEMLANFISSITSVLSVAGAIIGSFSILVGGFGIANIMFVSVKERTNIIGIQKSLGAKNYFIMVQFLFEAVFLSLLGGLFGLGLVSLLTFASNDTFQIVFSLKNAMLGMGISIAIGVLSGLAPAFVAARLDPVEAIRSK